MADGVNRGEYWSNLCIFRYYPSVAVKLHLWFFCRGRGWHRFFMAAESTAPCTDSQGTLKLVDDGTAQLELVDDGW